MKQMHFKNKQISLDFSPGREQCKHRSCFVSMAYVPAGMVCSRCGMLLSQYIPQPTAVIGYLSADWAWSQEGRSWTTQEER